MNGTPSLAPTPARIRKPGRLAGLAVTPARSAPVAQSPEQIKEDRINKIMQLKISKSALREDPHYARENLAQLSPAFLEAYADSDSAYFEDWAKMMGHPIEELLKMPEGFVDNAAGSSYFLTIIRGRIVELQKLGITKPHDILAWCTAMRVPESDLLSGRFDDIAGAIRLFVEASLQPEHITDYFSTLKLQPDPTYGYMWVAGAIASFSERAAGRSESIWVLHRDIEIAPNTVSAKFVLWQDQLGWQPSCLNDRLECLRVIFECQQSGIECDDMKRLCAAVGISSFKDLPFETARSYFQMCHHLLKSWQHEGVSVDDGCRSLVRMLDSSSDTPLEGPSSSSARTDYRTTNVFSLLEVASEAGISLADLMTWSLDLGVSVRTERDARIIAETAQIAKKLELKPSELIQWAKGLADPDAERFQVGRSAQEWLEVAQSSRLFLAYDLRPGEVLWAHDLGVKWPEDTGEFRELLSLVNDFKVGGMAGHEIRAWVDDLDLHGKIKTLDDLVQLKDILLSFKEKDITLQALNETYSDVQHNLNDLYVFATISVLRWSHPFAISISDPADKAALQSVANWFLAENATTNSDHWKQLPIILRSFIQKLNIPIRNVQDLIDVVEKLKILFEFRQDKDQKPREYMLALINNPDPAAVEKVRLTLAPESP